MHHPFYIDHQHIHSHSLEGSLFPHYHTEECVLMHMSSMLLMFHCMLHISHHMLHIFLLCWWTHWCFCKCHMFLCLHMFYRMSHKDNMHHPFYIDHQHIHSHNLEGSLFLHCYTEEDVLMHISHTCMLHHCNHCTFHHIWYTLDCLLHVYIDQDN